MKKLAKIIYCGIILFIIAFFIAAIFGQPRIQPVDFSKMSFEEIRAFHQGTGAQNVMAGITPNNPLYFADRFGEWFVLNIIAKKPSKQLERITLFSQEKIAELAKSDAMSSPIINTQLTSYLNEISQLFVVEEINTTEQGKAAQLFALRALRSEQDQLAAITQNNANEIISAAITKIVNLQKAGYQLETTNETQ